jgi:thioredoxin 1
VRVPGTPRRVGALSRRTQHGDPLSQPLILTDADFAGQIEEHDGVALVDVWAAWCGPCRALAPTVEELSRTYDGRVRVAKLDLDAHPATPERFGVRSIPTLLVFNRGKLVDRLVGVRPASAIAEVLDRHLNVA